LIVLRGTPASPGVGIGRASVICGAQRTAATDADSRCRINARQEQDRLRSAQNAVRLDLEAMRSRETTPGNEIIEMYLVMLDDPELIPKATLAVSELGISAHDALERVIDAASRALEILDHDYLRARAADVRSLGSRLLQSMSDQSCTDCGKLEGIIIADDMGPLDLLGLDASKVLGIATRYGNAASHTAILAKSLGIPVIVNLAGQLDQVQDGQLLVVDGDSGELVLNLDEPACDYYLKRWRGSHADADARWKDRMRPAITSDGFQVCIAANIAGPREAETAFDAGAEAVGLFRTEFLFMHGQALPSEEEQFRAYVEALDRAKGRPVTIRTLDAGGDKAVPGLELAAEANPFMGLRGIRLVLRNQDILKTQMRALSRAAAHGSLLVMFPMIAQPSELRQAKAVMHEAWAELRKEHAEHKRDFAVGAMIELPSAVFMAGELAEEADFFSIGTNDLAQYTLGADRTNPDVADLCDYLHPAVLRAIDQTVKAARQACIPVAVCGEMASDPAAAILLVGLGVAELSMVPSAIPRIKAAVRRFDRGLASQLAQDALAMSTTDEVRQTLAKAVF